jgi:WD40 repeat protein/transcriptional regulator with XRE-family HTH domain
MLRVAFHQELKHERTRRGWSQEDLAERVGVDAKTVQRWEAGQRLPRLYHRQKLCEVFGKTLEELGLLPTARIDWREKPDSSSFFGRRQELAALERWIERCRLIAVLGIGGIGKTTLVAQLVERASGEALVDYSLWRSLRSAPPLTRLLKDCISFFSDHQQIDMPSSEEEQLTLLMDLLRQRRCLLVLDNFDALLEGGRSAGHYRPGYEGYGRLLERLGNEQHLSVVLLTSREKPREISPPEGAGTPVRSLVLQGVDAAAGHAILEEKGITGNHGEVHALIQRYGGNPLALRLVAETIQELFAGQIGAFLAENQTAIGDIRDLLEQHLSRLTPREREVLYWLAIEQEAVSLEELRADLVEPEAHRELIGALDSLRRRSLIEVRAQGSFTLQPVIMEYVQDELIGQACDDFLTGHLASWACYAFIKARTRDYVRESQIRLILAPLAERLRHALGQAALLEQARTLLALLRHQSRFQNGYTAGNLLNLLVYLQCDLRGFDFSWLTIRQAYLQKARLPEVNFAHARFSATLFQDTLANVLATAFSQDGQRLAVGTASGEIRLYEGDCSSLLQVLREHSDGVWALAFSCDGRLLVSGSDDQTLRLWELPEGRCVAVLQGHTDRVRALALSPDGRLLVSGSDDQTLRLWGLPEGRCVAVLGGHRGRIEALALSLDGQCLASGDSLGDILLWEMGAVAQAGELEALREFRPVPVPLKGHADQVRALAFSSDGALLVSGSDDRTVRLWDVAARRCRALLSGHSNRVWSVALHPNGALLASAGEDTTIRLWSTADAQQVATLSGHTHGVRTVNFFPDGQRPWLVSGGDDQTICLWDVGARHLLMRVQGYTTRLWAVAFTPDGKTLVSAGEDHALSLWDVESGLCRRRLYTATHAPLCLACSPDGSLLASAGEDQAIWLWPLEGRQDPLRLQGHSDWVRSLAFSPDGALLASGGEDEIIYLWAVAGWSGSGSALPIRPMARLAAQSWIRALAFRPGGAPLWLASGGDDQVIRLWDPEGARCLRTLEGHSGRVRGLAFSPDGVLLASAGEDGQVLLWEVESGRLLQRLRAHRGRVRSVSFSVDGRWLASSGDDLMICLWERSGTLLRRIASGHMQTVRALCFAPHGSLLASAGDDGRIGLWEGETGRCLRMLSGPRPYEGMNIKGVEGLSEAQKKALLALGAVEVDEE